LTAAAGLFSALRSASMEANCFDRRLIFQLKPAYPKLSFGVPFRAAALLYSKLEKKDSIYPKLFVLRIFDFSIQQFV